VLDASSGYRATVNSKRDLDESAVGQTADGVRWRWAGGRVPASRLKLHAPVEQSTHADRWRFEQSLRVFRLFAVLQLPNVTVDWLRPPSSRPITEWMITDDFLPQWEFAHERHAFLHGITAKLWSELEFEPNPPTSFVCEWVAWHIDCDRDDAPDPSSPWSREPKAPCADQSHVRRRDK
jgi:hypothetical protein